MLTSASNDMPAEPVATSEPIMTVAPPHDVTRTKTLRVSVPIRSQCDLVTEDDGLISQFLGYNSNCVDFIDDPEHADLVVLFEQFSFKQRSHIQTLLKSPLVRQCAHKLFVINYDDTGQGFLPGCYTSLRRSTFDARIHKSCAYPKNYNQFVGVPNDSAATHLYSFRGSLDSHPVRSKLFNTLRYDPEGLLNPVCQSLNTHTESQKRLFVEEVAKSSFVLCPRGQGPSSYRLFEVMALGRCPVIISDDWIPIGGVDWKTVSVRISESIVHEIPNVLKRLRCNATEMGVRARQVWEAHFSPPAKFRSFLEDIVALSWENRDGQLTSFRSLESRLRSCEFSWRCGWTLPQRVGRLVRRVTKW